MEKLTKILTGLLLIFWLSDGVNAQTIGSITPFNAAASANEIYEIFGSQINVSAAQIHNFYQAQWLDGPYSGLCTNSNLSVGFMDNDKIYLEWNPQSGKTFQVSYLRFSDGTTETFSTNKSYMTLSLPNDLYLFSLQTDCGNSQSTLGIIIIDKPVMYESKQDCFCSEYEEVKKERIGRKIKQSLFADYIWAPANPNAVETYHIEVIGNNGQLNSGFHTTITFEEGVPQTAHLSSICTYNIINPINGTNTIFAITPLLEVPYGVFTFSQNGYFAESLNNPAVPALRFVSFGNIMYNGQMIVKKCLDTGTSKRRSSSETTVEMVKVMELKSWPNPFTDHTTVEYVLSTPEEVNLSLLNAYGQTIRTLQKSTMTEAGTHQLTIDLTSLPSGIYWCMMRTKQTYKTIRLLKTE